MLEPQFVFVRPTHSHRSIEAAKVHAAVAERDPRVPQSRTALAANDWASANAFQAIDQPLQEPLRHLLESQPLEPRSGSGGRGRRAERCSTVIPQRNVFREWKWT